MVRVVAAPAVTGSSTAAASAASNGTRRTSRRMRATVVMPSKSAGKTHRFAQYGRKSGEPFRWSDTLTGVRHPERHQEQEQFRATYLTLYPTIAKYAWSLTHDQDLAQEITQETFARLFARWSKVNDPGAYAYRIATNLIRASWRKRRDDRLRLQQVSRALLLETSTSDQHGAIDLWQVVDGLPRRYRELVRLHYGVDLPLPEVARRLDRPLGTVKRQICEARTLLASALEGAR